MEYTTTNEQKLKEVFAQIKMRDTKPSHNKPRIKRYEKVYMNFTYIPQVQSVLSANNEIYVVITEERAKYITKGQFDFFANHLPEKWILLKGRKSSVHEELRSRFKITHIDR